MEFSWFTPCAGNNRICYPAILAEGAIEADSDRKLRQFISDKKQYLTDGLGSNICFNSPGGDLIGSVRLGRLIRDLEFDTCLAPTYDRVIAGTLGDQETFVKDAVCVSACAFALLGGINRSIEIGSKYGIHQFYGAAGNIGDSATQRTIVMLATYIEHMGVDRALLDVASLVPSEQVHWLSLKDLRELRVDNIDPAKAEWRLIPLANGDVVAHINQIKPVYQSQISLAFIKHSDHLLLAVTFFPNKRRSSMKRVALAFDGSYGMGGITLDVDNRNIGKYVAPSWEVGKETVGALVPLSPLAVESIRLGHVLSLKVNIAHAYEDCDPSLEFPLDGVGRLLNAVLR